MPGLRFRTGVILMSYALSLLVLSLIALAQDPDEEAAPIEEVADSVPDLPPLPETPVDAKGEAVEATASAVAAEAVDTAQAVLAKLKVLAPEAAAQVKAEATGDQLCEGLEHESLEICMAQVRLLDVVEEHHPAEAQVPGDPEEALMDTGLLLDPIPTESYDVATTTAVAAEG